MPEFAIERQYLLPLYQHLLIEAPDLATACRKALDDDDWESAAEDAENARPTTIAGAVELPEGYEPSLADPSAFAASAFRDPELPRLAVPAEFTGEETAPQLDDRQLATLLAALRYWQRRGHFACREIRDIATNGDTLTPLSAKEIDELCERLNLAR